VRHDLTQNTAWRSGPTGLRPLDRGRLILAGASRGRQADPARRTICPWTALSQVRSSASYDFARRPAQYAKSGRQIGLAGGGPPSMLACWRVGGQALLHPNISVSGSRFSPSGLLGGKWLPRCVSSDGQRWLRAPTRRKREAGHPTRSQGTDAGRLRRLDPGPTQLTQDSVRRGGRGRQDAEYPRSLPARRGQNRLRRSSFNSFTQRSASSAPKPPDRPPIEPRRPTAALISLGSFGSP